MSRYGKFFASVLITLIALPVSAAGDASTSPLPTTGLYATFNVGTEVFHASITNPASMSDAILLWRGMSTKKIPSGRLSCTAANWNAPWHWHLIPSTVVFSHYAIEVCDGAPSDVERGCPAFGMGSYCPWNASMVQLRDCRFDRRCPLVPR